MWAFSFALLLGAVACSKSAPATTIPPGTLEPDKLETGTCAELPALLVASGTITVVDGSDGTIAALKIAPSKNVPGLSFSTDDITVAVGIGFATRFVEGKPVTIGIDGNKLEIHVKKNLDVAKGSFSILGNCDVAFRLEIAVTWPEQLVVGAAVEVTAVPQKR